VSYVAWLSELVSLIQNARAKRKSRQAGAAAHGKTFVAVALTVQTRNAASIIANAERVLIHGRRSYVPRCSLERDAPAQETKAAVARAESSAYKNVRYRANFCLPSACVMRLTT
jgi:hypothetical protein